MPIDFFALLLCRLRATIELWCNGNTADFGSVILSSNLGSSTKKEVSDDLLFLWYLLALWRVVLAVDDYVAYSLQITESVFAVGQ